MRRTGAMGQRLSSCMESASLKAGKLDPHCRILIGSHYEDEPEESKDRKTIKVRSKHTEIKDTPIALCGL